MIKQLVVTIHVKNRWKERVEESIANIAKCFEETSHKIGRKLFDRLRKGDFRFGKEFCLEGLGNTKLKIAYWNDKRLIFIMDEEDDKIILRSVFVLDQAGGGAGRRIIS